MMIHESTENEPEGMRYVYNKSMKPLMEKRRRARINSSLEELKSILQNLLSEGALVSSKMEKADILDLAVKFLRGMRRKNMNVACQLDPHAVNKFQSGYMDCMSEISRFVASSSALPRDMHSQMIDHLMRSSPMSSPPQPSPPMFPYGMPSLEPFSPLSIVPSLSPVQPQRLPSLSSLGSPHSDISDQFPSVPDLDAVLSKTLKREPISPYMMKSHQNKMRHSKHSQVWRPW